MQESSDHYQKLLEENALLKQKIGILEKSAEELRQTESALRKSEEKYRELVENANSIILRMDRHGILTFMNEFGLMFFGFSEKEIIGRHVIGTIVPETETTGRDLRTLLEKICWAPRDYEQNINENIRRTGERVFISWTNKPVLDSQGQLTEVLSIGSDITERRRMEEALRKNEELFTRLVDTIPDLVIYTDLSGTILFANNYDFEKVSGYRKEDVVGHNMLSFMTPEDQIRAAENTFIMMDGKMGPQEYRMVKKDGDITHFEVNGDVLRYEDGNPFGLVHVCRHIDDRKQIQEERERYISELKKALQEVKTLSGLLPICSSCKKIRDDKGYWNQIESYIQSHSEAQFSHGMCPECVKKLYPKLYQEKSSPDAQG